jgi:hypothetical protein
MQRFFAGICGLNLSLMTNDHLSSEHDLGVTVPLHESSPNWPPFSEEILKVRQDDSGCYRIDCIPWFTYGLNFGDVIEASRQNDRLEFVRVARPSGHSTYRIRLDISKVLTPTGDGGVNPLWTALSEALESLACRIEASSDRLHSLDVPPDPTIDKRAVVLDLLKVGKEEGLFDFEEGTFL